MHNKKREFFISPTFTISFQRKSASHLYCRRWWTFWTVGDPKLFAGMSWIAGPRVASVYSETKPRIHTPNFAGESTSYRQIGFYWMRLLGDCSGMVCVWLDYSLWIELSQKLLRLEVFRDVLRSLKGWMLKPMSVTIFHVSFTLGIFLYLKQKGQFLFKKRLKQARSFSWLN